MENVDMIEKSQTLLKAIEIFCEAGYGLTNVVLDASMCGVPQKRKRVFDRTIRKRRLILKTIVSGKSK